MLVLRLLHVIHIRIGCALFYEANKAFAGKLLPCCLCLAGQTDGCSSADDYGAKSHGKSEKFPWVLPSLGRQIKPYARRCQSYSLELQRASASVGAFFMQQSTSEIYCKPCGVKP
jgi:hypothetical protein